MLHRTKDNIKHLIPFRKILFTIIDYYNQILYIKITLIKTMNNYKGVVLIASIGLAANVLFKIYNKFKTAQHKK